MFRAACARTLSRASSRLPSDRYEDVRVGLAVANERLRCFRGNVPAYSGPTAGVLARRRPGFTGPVSSLEEQTRRDHRPAKRRLSAWQTLPVALTVPSRPVCSYGCLAARLRGARAGFSEGRPAPLLLLEANAPKATNATTPVTTAPTVQALLGTFWMASRAAPTPLSTEARAPPSEPLASSVAGAEFACA